MRDSNREPGLFDDDSVRRLSHQRDPSTSKQAAIVHDATGVRQKHAARILSIVDEHPGRTAIEIQSIDGELTEYQVRRRLSDLKNVGKVQYGESRKCRVKGTRMVTWLASEGE